MRQAARLQVARRVVAPVTVTVMHLQLLTASAHDTAATVARDHELAQRAPSAAAAVALAGARASVLADSCQ